ncbi:hypothetical protein C8A00DRAFT_35861 [Chaetomidium leptoderma]|uniref:Uncharacterized protein n=1 Tax=Chaetomidium leptoderma TaxID=669021 RepID=A0AAN6VJC8_9PEZI|nr:hypothetical protein C8A00DRAFT_35861 [Chaetomidium leptoderma]
MGEPALSLLAAAAATFGGQSDTLAATLDPAEVEAVHALMATSRARPSALLDEALARPNRPGAKNASGRTPLPARRPVSAPAALGPAAGPSNPATASARASAPAPSAPAPSLPDADGKKIKAAGEWRVALGWMTFGSRREPPCGCCSRREAELAKNRDRGDGGLASPKVVRADQLLPCTDRPGGGGNAKHGDTPPCARCKALHYSCKRE